MNHRCYPIIDLDFRGEAAAQELAAALGDAGCSMVELRAKRSSAAEYYRFAVEAVRAAGEDCRVVVNDRLDIALAASAGGVHVGERDLPVAAARKLAPQGFIVGATARDPESALAAERDGADYIGAGAVFPTEQKDDTRLIGVEGLAEIAAAVDIPVFGIAGVTAENCTTAVEAGAWGVSCISAVAAADNPAARWLKMERAMQQAAARQPRPGGRRKF